MYFDLLVVGGNIFLCIYPNKSWRCNKVQTESDDRKYNGEKSLETVKKEL